MVQNLAKITLKQIDNSIAEDAFLFVSEVFATRSTLHRAINIEINLCRDYLKAGYQQPITPDISNLIGIIQFIKLSLIRNISAKYLY